MELVDTNELQWTRVSGHRDGDIRFKRLFLGAEGALDNYEFSLVATRGAYHTPRHNHNFEQIRFCLDGAINFGPGRNVKTGQIGYFPEGTPYGPQDIVEQVAMVVQFGGASGQGFMSYRQLENGFEEMKKRGNFERGVFKRGPGEEGRMNQDGYEAIWEMVNGRKVEYPKRRYEEPVLMDPDAFAWRADPARPGVARKTLGVFSERELRLEMLRLEEGASIDLAPETGFVLGYLRSGSLSANGKEWPAGTALRASPEKPAALRATSPAEILVMTFPPIA